MINGHKLMIVQFFLYLGFVEAAAKPQPPPSARVEQADGQDSRSDAGY